MHNRHKKQSGFSLLEVLISMVVIATGLLGMTTLQMVALKETGNSHSRNVAIALSTNLADAMRANPLGVEGGFYAGSVSCTGRPEKECNRYLCTPEEAARYDIEEVLCGEKYGTHPNEGGIVNYLPQGELNVSCGVPSNCISAAGERRKEHTIKISWKRTQSHKDQVTSTNRRNNNGVSQSMTLSVTP